MNIKDPKRKQNAQILALMTALVFIHRLLIRLLESVIITKTGPTQSVLIWEPPPPRHTSDVQVGMNSRIGSNSLFCNCLVIILAQIVTYLLFKVNGGWGEWHAWTECSVNCGRGEITRNRACDNPAPQHGGYLCTVDGSQTETETETCNQTPCPSKLIL